MKVFNFGNLAPFSCLHEGGGNCSFGSTKNVGYFLLLGGNS
jgi:hypothetical protein